MRNGFFGQMQGNVKRNPIQWLMGLVMLIAFFVLLFWVFKGIFAILSYAAPVLIILAAFINYRVITDYVAMLWGVFKNNWLMGILGGLLTVVGFPLVAGFLFVKALMLRKVKTLQEEAELRREGEFVEFEDLSEEPPESLILKEPELKTPPREENRYDRMF